MLVSPPQGAPLLSGVKRLLRGPRHERLDQSPPEGAYNPPLPGTTGLDFAELDPNLVVRTGTVWGSSDQLEPYGLALDRWGQDEGVCLGAPGGQDRRHMVAITADGSSVVWTFKREPVMVSPRPWQDVAEGQRSARKRGQVPELDWWRPQPAADRV